MVQIGPVLLETSSLHTGKTVERTFGINRHPAGHQDGLNATLCCNAQELPSIGLPPMGLVVAIYALTLIASLAGDQFQLKGVLVLATVLSVGSYLAFVVALNLQFPVWPTFITG